MSEFPKTNTSSIEKRARSVDEAVSEALAELGIGKEEAAVEIIQEPSKGFLGLGAKEAVVKVSVRSDEPEPVKPAEPAKPAPKEEKPDVSEPETEARPMPSEADMSEAINTAKSFINSILTAMSLDVKIDAHADGDIININLEGENMGIVIGKRGDTLDSLQYLTSLVVNRNSEGYIKISIDTENYRAKRTETLIALSNKLAARVAKTGKKYPLEEMNPYERRIIHSNLQDNEAVTTYSVGQEPHRKVVIAPKNPRPYGGKRGYGKNQNRSRKRPNTGKGGYSRPDYSKSDSKTAPASHSATYKADFKPTPHKPEYKDFAEYLAAQSKD